MSSVPIPPPGAPPAARGLTRNLDTPSVQTKLSVRNNQLFIIALVEFILLGLMIAALLVLIPLKTTKPILVERDTSTGAVRAVTSSAEVYQPTQSDVKYFLHRYVVQTNSINRLTTERDIEEARTYFTRGKAVSQLDAFFDRERPIARLRTDPGLTRKVEVGSVSIFKGGAAVKYTLIEQGTSERESKRTKMVSTIQFSLIPPEDEKSIFSNPAGLFVTDLDFIRDLES